MLKKLKYSKGFLKYFKNTSWLFIEKILRMIVGLTVGVWIARYLGPDQFGLFSYAQSFVSLFTIFATLGLEGIIVREFVKDDSRRDDLLGTAFSLKLVGAFFVLIGLLIAINFTSNDYYTNMLIFIIASGTVFQSFNVIDYYFRSKVLSKFIVYANIFTLFVSTIIKIILILNKTSLIAFAYVVLFDSFILAMGYTYFYVKNTTHLSKWSFTLFKWNFDKNVAISLLKDSWPLIIAGTALLIQAYIDQIMIKEMLGNKSVGYYSVAIKFIALFGFIPMILTSSLLPAIISSKEKSINLYKYRLLNYYRLNFLFFIVIAIPIFIFAEQIVVFLFGIKYKESGILLALMSSRLFFTNMGVAREAFILTENLFKFSLITMILGTIVNVVLNYFLIRQYGAVGAIIATIISFTVTIFLLDIFYSKTRNNFLMMMKGIFSFYKINFRMNKWT